MIKYADGSITNHSVAAGSTCSSTAAELHATIIGLVNISPNNNVKTLRYFLDSQTAIMSLRRGYKRQSSEMGRKILKKMQNLQNDSIETNLFWVPSHCGIQEKELADETDKAGSQSHKCVRLEIPLVGKRL